MILLSLAAFSLVLGFCWTLGCWFGDLLKAAISRALYNPVPDFSHPVWKEGGA